MNKANIVDVPSNDLSSRQNAMHAEQLLLESLIRRKRLLERLKLEIKRREKRKDWQTRMKMRMVALRLVVHPAMARRKRKRRSSIAL